MNYFGSLLFGIKHPNHGKKKNIKACFQKLTPTRGLKPNPNHQKKLARTQFWSSIALWVTLLQLIIYPLFQLWFVNFLKHRIPNFLSFKFIYSLSCVTYGRLPQFWVKVGVNVLPWFLLVFSLNFLRKEPYFHGWIASRSFEYQSLSWLGSHNGI